MKYRGVLRKLVTLAEASGGLEGCECVSDVPRGQEGGMSRATVAARH